MASTRKTRIEAAFAARAADYDAHADLQGRIADRLARHLPALNAPKVLEVGCGTGLLTRHLFSAYPEGHFVISDLAQPMLEVCQHRLAAEAGSRARFTVMDGEAPRSEGRFDLIATSMTLQWFADPMRGLERLAKLLGPGGHLIFATLGPQCFSEWRQTLAACGWPDGLIDMPRLPGVVEEERPRLDLAGGLAFLRRLRSMGAATPRAGYKPLSAGALRRALRELDRTRGGRVTWHLVYGHLTS